MAPGEGDGARVGTGGRRDWIMSCWQEGCCCSWWRCWVVLPTAEPPWFRLHAGATPHGSV
jgi:hypothetical protein